MRRKLKSGDDSWKIVRIETLEWRKTFLRAICKNKITISCFLFSNTRIVFLDRKIFHWNPKFSQVINCIRFAVVFSNYLKVSFSFDIQLCLMKNYKQTKIFRGADKVYNWSATLEDTWESVSKVFSVTIAFSATDREVNFKQAYPNKKLCPQFRTISF